MLSKPRRQGELRSREGEFWWELGLFRGQSWTRLAALTFETLGCGTVCFWHMLSSSCMQGKAGSVGLFTTGRFVLEFPTMAWHLE